MPDAGALIREARRRNRVSQEALARRARTTQKQISRIESGEISPSVSTLSRLLAAMGERSAAVIRSALQAAPLLSVSRTLTGIAAPGR